MMKHAVAALFTALLIVPPADIDAAETKPPPNFVIITKTLVLFTSDNGGSRGCLNKPLRGGKGSAWEGGVREPALAWWPETIPAGSVCDQLATAMDLLPTFARLG